MISKDGSKLNSSYNIPVTGIMQISQKMDIVVWSNILSYLENPRQLMRISKICHDSIVNNEFLYKTHVPYSRSKINIAALENRWYSVYIGVSEKDIDWVLHLCIVFGKIELAKHLYKRYLFPRKDKLLYLSLIPHSIEDLMRCFYKVSSSKDILGCITPEMYKNILATVDLGNIPFYQYLLLMKCRDSKYGIPFWELHCGLENKSRDMKFVTHGILRECLETELCYSPKMHIIDTLRYFGFKSVTLLEFLGQI